VDPFPRINYVVDRVKKTIVSKFIAAKEIQNHTRSQDHEDRHRQGTAKKREAVVLTEDEILQLANYAEILEKHYGIPQDIEWGVEKNKIYILQSRPITTINNSKKPAAEAITKGKILMTGLGASPGVATGIEGSSPPGKDLGKIKQGNIMVTKMTMPTWFLE